MSRGRTLTRNLSPGLEMMRKIATGLQYISFDSFCEVHQLQLHG